MLMHGLPRECGSLAKTNLQSISAKKKMLAEVRAGDPQQFGAHQVDADVLMRRHRFARSLGGPKLPPWPRLAGGRKRTVNAHRMLALMTIWSSRMSLHA